MGKGILSSCRACCRSCCCCGGGDGSSHGGKLLCGGCGGGMCGSCASGGYGGGSTAGYGGCFGYGGNGGGHGTYWGPGGRVRIMPAYNHPTRDAHHSSSTSTVYDVQDGYVVRAATRSRGPAGLGPNHTAESGLLYTHIGLSVVTVIHRRRDRGREDRQLLGHRGRHPAHRPRERGRQQQQREPRRGQEPRRHHPRAVPMPGQAAAGRVDPGQARGRRQGPSLLHRVI